MKSRFLLMCLFGLLGVMRPVGADETSPLQSLVEKVSPSIVTIKVVMKSQSGGQERESKMDMPGVIVDKDGLIMISNVIFSPARLSGLFGRGNGESSEFKILPTDFKVLIDQDDKEYTAFLAATDTKMDLAFIKIDKLGDKKLTAVDFGAGSVGSIGQPIVSVCRLHKGFDYAPYFETSHISGLISKPKKAYLTEGGISGLGLPIFTMSGEPLGVLTTLESGLKDEELIEGMQFNMMTHQIIGGASGTLRAFIIPSQTVNGIISQAKLKAVEVAAERAKKPAPKPDATKKDPTKKDAKPSK